MFVAMLLTRVLVSFLQSGNNKPLLAPRSGELLGARMQSETEYKDKMLIFVQLRQDLERIRNLCYMVGRREKLCRTLLRLREQTFHKQNKILLSGPLSPSATTAVLAANHGPLIYDQVYSHSEAGSYTGTIESLIMKIKGVSSPSSRSSTEKKFQPDFNGASSKKIYLNGSISKRKSIYSSDLSSLSGSDLELDKNASAKTTPKSKSNRVGFLD